jgi:BirA family biotin operon repressor/biotin-[acetyl-CoA-carboxylase] ligase
VEEGNVACKQEVLALLEKQKGSRISGEAIAAVLSVSRAAVWRAIKDLQAEGHAIDASTRVGYRLQDSSDILSVEGIRPYLALVSRETLSAIQSSIPPIARSGG